MRTKIKDTKAIWIVSVVVLSALLAIFITLFAISATQNRANMQALEDIYSKNFYDLVDNINNTENKLAKVLSASSGKMQSKYLEEVSNNARLASSSLNSLPYSGGEFRQNVAFVNQLSGYAQTLSKSLQEGQTLQAKDRKTLEEVYDSVLYMKENLALMNGSMWEGYSILGSSKKFEGEKNAFTNSLSKIKNVDVDYPTMIYDGPFSNSVINKEVKGLKDAEVSAEQAKQNLHKIFASLDEASVEYKNDSTGRFETYNFAAKNQNGNEYLFIQMTKAGGHLLTATSYADKKSEEISMENAKEIAVNFCARAGIENMQVVWSDKISGNAYINLAPVQNKYILYPDLIKVKIDMAQGDVLGFEATNYYINHTERQFVQPQITKETAIKSVPTKYAVKFARLALIPLEYNQEVFCFEVAATLGQDEYYFYFNAQTGDEENVLKVINTNNGNLLM